jgi:hypothetical protein
MFLSYTKIVDLVSVLSAGLQRIIKLSRSPCLGIPNDGTEPEVFNVRAVRILEGGALKAINSIYYCMR